MRKGRIFVIGPGGRGNHGCSDSLELDGYLAPLHGREKESQHPSGFKAEGTVTAVTDCPYCGTENWRLVGQKVTLYGWWHPSYYGHDGLQQ